MRVEGPQVQETAGRSGQVSVMYQLVFKGEVIEGQHPAVVRKRLALTLKLDDERIQTLFTGNPVVVRKSVDAQTAAKFQAAFKKAGARLRVIQLPDEQAETSEAGVNEAGVNTADTGKPRDAAGSEWEILPPGSDLLDPEQRQPFTTRSIDTSHLVLAKQLAFQSASERYDPSTIDAPDFEVMAAGSRIGGESSTEEAPLDLDIDFELAEPGATLGVKRAPASPTRVPDPRFDLAEPGVRMSEPAPPPPPAPDVSHIKLK